MLMLRILMRTMSNLWPNVPPDYPLSFSDQSGSGKMITMCQIPITSLFDLPTLNVASGKNG